MRQAFLYALSMVAAVCAASVPASAGPDVMARPAAAEVTSDALQFVGWRTHSNPPVNSYEDRYRYEYQPRGYYPYYNSGYWVPRETVRPNYDFVQPPYYQAWGDWVLGYNHREWHRENHGRVPFWQY